MSHIDEHAHFLYLSPKYLRLCNLYSTPLLVEEHGIYLLLQGGDHGEELFLSGGWWLLVRGGRCHAGQLFRQ